MTINPYNLGNRKVPRFDAITFICEGCTQRQHHCVRKGRKSIPCFACHRKHSITQTDIVKLFSGE